MEEIKTVIDRLKDKLEVLEKENTNDLASINEKQTNIDNLSKEIENLQHEIEARKEDMSKLDEKMKEAEDFDKSIGEVASLIEEDEKVEAEVHEEVKEEVPAEEPDMLANINPEEEVHEEVQEEAPVEENTFNPFGDLTTSNEVKEDAFDFKSTMNDYNEPEENDLPTLSAIDGEAAAAPMEEVNNEVNGPIFNDQGFDISGNVNNEVVSEQASNEFPNIGLNEMYNEPTYEENAMIR